MSENAGNSTFDTIIVGAGFAGLTAARQLASTDQSVAVLEARERAGGRTWTQPFAGLPFDLGGSYFHWFMPHVWREISRYGLTLKEAPHAVVGGWVSQGKYQEGPITVLWERLDRLMASFAHDSAVVLERPYDPTFRADELAAVDKLSVQDRIDELSLDDEDRDILNGFLQIACSGPCSEAGLVSMLRWWALTGNDLTLFLDAVGRYSLVGGTKSLLDAFMNDVKAELRFGAVVERVAVAGDGVVMTMRGGGQVRGKKAIIAVPLNTLGAIQFDPMPTPEIARLSERGQAGRGMKVWIHVSNELEDFFAQAPDTYPISFVKSEMPHPDGGTILLGFGPDGDVDVGNLESVREAFSQFRPDLDVIAVTGHNWRPDEFARGTWAILRPTQATELVPALRKPHGRLMFAGSDLAYGWNGWVDGAIESGLHAARFALDEMS